MNTETFKLVDTKQMQDEIDEAIRKGRQPAQYIEVGNETRQARRARERAADKALRKQAKRMAKA